VQRELGKDHGSEEVEDGGREERFSSEVLLE